jgi:hypothetical protein
MSKETDDYMTDVSNRVCEWECLQLVDFVVERER